MIPNGIYDNAISTWSIQAYAINQSESSFTNQIPSIDLIDNGEGVMNKDLDMSHNKPEGGAELDIYCKNTLWVYESSLLSSFIFYTFT